MKKMEFICGNISIKEDIIADTTMGVHMDFEKSDGEVEIVLVIISSIDDNDYMDNKTDKKYKRVGILVNATGDLPWGCYVPYKLNGSERPIIKMNEIYEKGNTLYYSTDVINRYPDDNFPETYE